MDDIVERVAMAMHNAKTPQSLFAWHRTDECYREWKRREARAAIAAMREPTQAMAAAMFNRLDGRSAHAYGHIGAAWTAGIDAAIEVRSDG